jgi:hypothetical protein
MKSMFISSVGKPSWIWVSFKDMNQITVDRNPLYIIHVGELYFLWMLLGCSNKPTAECT